MLLYRFEFKSDGATWFEYAEADELDLKVKFYNETGQKYHKVTMLHVTPAGDITDACRGT